MEHRTKDATAEPVARQTTVPGPLTRWRWPLFALLAGAIFCEAAWLVFLTPNEQDLAHYECYGVTFWQGSQAAAQLPRAMCSYLFQGVPVPPASSPLPLHMLPIEYPPLTVLPFSLPLLAPLPFYALTFALLMTLAAGLVYWLLAHSAARQAAPIFLLYLLLGAAGVFQERFDLLPAACTVLCVLAAERGRWRTAYVALALGALLKLYPLVMLPALFLAEQRARPAPTANPRRPRPAGVMRLVSRWQDCLLCIALFVAVTGGFALLNVQDALISPLHYFLARPVQIESLAGSVLWSAGHFGTPYTIDFAFGSLNLESRLSPFITSLDTWLLLAGMLFLLWLQWSRRTELVQTMVGQVSLLIATGKVFSPQYLIWLIPLLAYLYARGKTSRAWMGCWAAIALLTTCIYILYYPHLIDPRLDPHLVETFSGFFELIMLRNALVLGATLVLLGGWWGARRGTHP